MTDTRALLVPCWSLDAGKAEYYGFRWWVQIGPLVVFVFPAPL